MPEKKRNSAHGESFSESTAIIVNGKTYSSIDEMPPEVREVYLEAMAIINETQPDQEEESGWPESPPRKYSVRRIVTTMTTRFRSPSAAGDDRIGFGSFLVILVFFTALQLLHCAIPGRRESWDDFIARQPSHGGFLETWICVVLPLTLFFWGGVYLFGERFWFALTYGVRALTYIALIIAVLVLAAIIIGMAIGIK